MRELSKLENVKLYIHKKDLELNEASTEEITVKK